MLKVEVKKNNNLKDDKKITRVNMLTRKTSNLSYEIKIFT
jgi:hypothetical protein